MDLHDLPAGLEPLLPEPLGMFCSKCGAPVGDEDVVCPDCGERLGEVDEFAAEPTVPQATGGGAAVIYAVLGLAAILALFGVLVVGLIMGVLRHFGAA